MQGGLASGLRAPVLFATPHITSDDIEAVNRVLHSGWLTTGTECQLLEDELAAYLGAKHVVGVSSCTAALEIALAYLRLRPGSRVGVPAWTFIASASAAVHNNLMPVLLDVEPGTLNLAPASLEAAIAQGLDAVVAVHFGGVPVSPAIHALCDAAGIPLVEDAAHALGAADERGPIGGAGAQAACFSFYATKNLTSGEGGALATDDSSLNHFARSYRLHGMSADAHARYRPDGSLMYDMVEPGIKANLPDLLAALARSQLQRFETMQSRREAIANRYRTQLEPAGLQFVPAIPVTASANHLAVVVLPMGIDRDEIVDDLKASGIYPSVHFRPLHHFTWFRENAVIGPTGLAVCDAFASRVLSLPLHIGLSDDDVDVVCEQLSALVHG